MRPRSVLVPFAAAPPMGFLMGVCGLMVLAAMSLAALAWACSLIAEQASEYCTALEGRCVDLMCDDEGEDESDG